MDDVQRRVLRALLAMQRLSWEQGVAGHAALDLGLGELAVALAHDGVTRQSADGRLADLDEPGAVNGAANGEAVVYARARTGDERYALAAARQLDWVVSRCPRADDGTLFHMVGTRQVWVDTVYMVTPYLVLAGQPDLAEQQLEGHRRRLYDAASGLYAHIWDETAQQLVRAAHWGSGNGWVAAGIARAVRHAGSPAALSPWARHAKELIDACLDHRAASGRFHDVLDDTSTFEEVTLCAMLAYACSTGVADGWLPPPYHGAATGLLATARAHVDAAGVLSPVCGAPHFDRPGTSAEAQAFYLLASAATLARGSE